MNTKTRLVIHAGILRIPVISAPEVFFHRKNDSCSAVTFSERHQESCLYGAYVGCYVGHEFVERKKNRYGTLRRIVLTLPVN